MYSLHMLLNARYFGYDRIVNHYIKLEADGGMV